MHGRSPLARRRRGLAGIVTLCLVLTFSAFVAGRQIKSPAQQAAETAPPAVTTMTAEVEYRVLRDTVVVRGVVETARRIEATPTSVYGADRLVVTAVRAAAADTIETGDVLAVVSGRPVIALPGAAPAYRDLRPDATGEDVTQLQEALRELGASISDRGGWYGPDTKRAVADMYADAGFTAPEAVEGADEELLGAERRRADAEIALTAVIEQAERDEDVARTELADAEAARDALPGDAGDAEAAAAQRRVSDAEVVLATVIEQAERDRSAAERERDDAVAALERMNGRAGAMLPLSEVVFVPRLPAEIIEVNAVVGEPPESPMIVIASGDLVVRGALPTTDRQAVREGLEVALSGELGEITGVVDDIGEQPGDELQGYPVTVSAELAPDWLGSDVRMSIVVAETAQEVLVVPVSAVFAGADAQTSVTRLRGAARQRVAVTVGAVGDGFVEVRSDELSPGDQVVVGERRDLA
jgi:HlyD family secretion protein